MCDCKLIQMLNNLAWWILAQLNEHQEMLEYWITGLPGTLEG